MTHPAAFHGDASFLWQEASLDELLALASQKYTLEFESVSAAGVTLDILQIANMKELLDKAIAEGALEDALNTLPLWAKIWPASIILGHMLRHVAPEGQRVLEVGAGCGVTGLIAAALGCGRVVITDINEDALLFARINILKNNLQTRAEVCRADVAADALNERFSLILGSEILYLEHLYRPLLKFILRHLAPQSALPSPQVLLATDHRRTAKPFFRQAQKHFTVQSKSVGASASSVDEASGRVERHLFTVHRLTHPGARDNANASG